MRTLSEFRDIHKGQDIYVIASGKSLDYQDLRFFEGKITIGINQLWKKMPTTYLVRKEIQMISDALEGAHPDTVHFISRGNCGGAGDTNAAYLRSAFPDVSNVVIYDHKPNNSQAAITSLPEDPNKLIVSYSTITTGIHLAAVMGAKNIILVGADCGTIDGMSNFDGQHTETTLSYAGGGIAGQNRRLGHFYDDNIALRTVLQRDYGVTMISLNPWLNFHLEGHVYEKCSR